MTYKESTVRQLQADLAVGTEECAAENPEVEVDDIAFDLAVSIATMADKPSAEEFLRREFGYIPDSYKRLVS